MTRLELITAFEECEYNIKKIELESFVPTSSIYCEAGGIEKLGDSIGVFFRKLDSNLSTMRAKYDIRRKYYFKNLAAQQNQQRNLRNLDRSDENPKFFPDVKKYASVAMSGIEKMSSALNKFRKAKYETVFDLRKGFMHFHEVVRDASDDLYDAMRPTRMMLVRDYADMIMGLKKQGIDFIKLSTKFDEMMELLAADAQNILDTKTLDLEFKQKYSETVKKIAVELSETQLNMMKCTQSIIEFKGTDK